mmetsp:Transcript_101825/g.141478  ORF Transcript_101825/g.141478 Transcript_101825/m.141478 type:complete len:226 (+) Transcript_101825:220-897(+)
MLLLPRAPKKKERRHLVPPWLGAEASYRELCTKASSTPKAKPVGQAASSPPVGGSSSTDVVVMVTVVSIMGSMVVVMVVAMVVVIMGVVMFPIIMVVVIVMFPLAMLNPESFREASWSQLPGLLISSSNSSLEPLVEPAYWAVSVKPSITTLTSSLNLRATLPGFASMLMLHRTVGAVALPLKTVRVVGATRDAESVSKSAFLRTAPLAASFTCFLAAANLLTSK